MTSPNLVHATGDGAASQSPFESFWPIADEGELQYLERFKKKIAIIRLWPDQAAAEHESIERFRRAAKAFGVKVIEVDSLGFTLHGTRERVTQNDVDFVISLHYETPKAYDCFSWGALWNPIDFYVEWGATPYLDHQFSHDGYFVCGSPVVDALARAELGDRYGSVPFVDVNHTLAGPVFSPRHKTNRRVAYCGINWERLSGKKGRFDDLLRGLDRKRVLDIYGPSEVRGVAVWEGFAGYKRSVPFDGVSLMGELADSGAVLALSSPAHVRSGVMSNRLFEAAAAGALVFTDRNPYVERYFKDEVVQLDLTGSAEDQAQQIDLKLRYYNENPEEALHKCQALQRKFLDQYNLHRQLFNVYETFGRWQAEQAAKVATDLGSIEFIILLTEDRLRFPDGLIKELAAQAYKNVQITLVLMNDKGVDDQIRDSLPGIDLKIVHVHKGQAGPVAIGLALSEALAAGSSDYCCIMLGHERIFHNYVHEMLSAAQRSLDGATCGVLVRHYDSAEREFAGAEHVRYVRPSDDQKNRVTLGNLVLKRSLLRRLAGAFQFMNWSDTAALIESSTRDTLAVADHPLMFANLKYFERLTKLDESMYDRERSAAIAERYMVDSRGRPLRKAEVHLRTDAISLEAIQSLTEDQRRLIIIELLKSFPVPNVLKKLVGKVIRLSLGIRRRPPQKKTS